jgi:hypothetical protein
MNIRTDEDFLKEIETIVSEKAITYYEALLYYVEENDIEIEVAAKLIKNNANLKSKIRENCEAINLVEKTTKLPV